MFDENIELDLSGKRILIVDDYQDMRVMLKSMLNSLQPEKIFTARDAKEAMEVIETKPIDIIFCDYNLDSGKDGQQILEEAKHRKLLPCSTIFIMITAENNFSMVMGAIEHIPDDYISKPFNRASIYTRLKRLVEKKDSMLQISRAVEDKDINLALHLCDDALKNDAKNELDLLKLKTELLVRIGKYEDAIQIYREVLRNRDIPWAQMGLAKAFMEQGDHSKAELHLHRIIEDNPSNVHAYDLLSQISEINEDYFKAQEYQNKAITISPKSILRHRKLAEIARTNGDMETCTKSYENAIKVGEYSCYRLPDDYAELAKSMMDQDEKQEALKVVDRIKDEFSENDSEAQFCATVASGLLHEEMGESKHSEKEVEHALNLFKRNPEHLSIDSIMDLTSLCLKFDKQEQAEKMVQMVVKNNFEDEKLINKAKAIFAKAGMAEEGERLINASRDEVIGINNKGARLLKEGKLEESIDLFMEAANVMRENIIINLNAAYSMLMLIKKTGDSRRYLIKAIEHLNRVYAIDPDNARYHSMMSMIHALEDEDRHAA